MDDYDPSIIDRCGAIELHADDGGVDDADQDGGNERAAMLPNSFWEARTLLQQIRGFARYRAAAPDAVFAMLLSRMGAIAPISARVAAVRGKRAEPLAIFSLVYAPSGVGKGSAHDAAAEALPAPDNDDVLMDAPVGSGEGIAEAFMGDVEVEIADKNGKPKIEIYRKQVRHRAHFFVDEGGDMMNLLKRRDSVLGGTLRTAFTGATIGQTNASVHRRRVVTNYCMSLSVCMTPDVAAELIAHKDNGMPQRFLWAAGFDLDAPADQADVGEPSLTTKPALITLDPVVGDGIMADRRARLRLESKHDELDSHAPRIQSRVAAILAMWDGRDVVNAEDWRLAGVVVETSTKVRDLALAKSKSQRAEAAVERGQENGIYMHSSREAEAAGADKTERLAAVVHKHVAQTGGCTKAAARHKVAHRDREWFVTALSYAERKGWVRVSDDRLTPGESRPS